MASNHNFSPKHLEASVNKPSIVTWFGFAETALGQRGDCEEDYVGAVPLMFAAKGGCIEAAELLVSAWAWELEKAIDAIEEKKSLKEDHRELDVGKRNGWIWWHAARLQTWLGTEISDSPSYPHTYLEEGHTVIRRKVDLFEWNLKLWAIHELSKPVLSEARAVPPHLCKIPNVQQRCLGARALEALRRVLVASLLLAAMPGAPGSVLAPSKVRSP